MSNGGNIDYEILIESFKKIKEDISKINEEIIELKRDYKSLIEDNINLKKSMNGKPLDEDTITRIVKKTIESFSRKDANTRLIDKIKRKKRMIIKNRILELAGSNSLSLPDLKDIVVEEEKLCSKATFYRYIEKMKQKNLIDALEIEERKVITLLKKPIERF